MKLQIILEKNDGILWGRVEEIGNYMPTPYGKTKAEVVQNLKELIKDYQAHEGKADKIWSKVNIDKLELEIRYDLQAFFMEHDYLNISSIAKRAGINASLMRHYAAGIKYPSMAQAKKIEDTIHELAKELESVSLFAA
jgi:predicted RNase H-like HicB family nuclease